MALEEPENTHRGVSKGNTHYWENTHAVKIKKSMPSNSIWDAVTNFATENLLSLPFFRCIFPIYLVVDIMSNKGGVQKTKSLLLVNNPNT